MAFGHRHWLYVLENATRLCQANFGVLFLCEEDAYRAVAMHNAPSAYVDARRREPLVSMTGTTVIAEVARTKRTIQTADMAKDPAYQKNPQYTQQPVKLANLALQGSIGPSDFPGQIDQPDVAISH